MWSVRWPQRDEFDALLAADPGLNPAVSKRMNLNISQLRQPWTSEWHSRVPGKDLSHFVHLTDTMLGPTLMIRVRRCVFRPGQVGIAYLDRYHEKLTSDNQLRPDPVPGDLDLAVYNAPELKSSDHRRFCRCLERWCGSWIGQKRDALAGLPVGECDIDCR